MWAMASPPSTCVTVVVAELGGRRLDHCILYIHVRVHYHVAIAYFIARAQ